MAEKRRTTVTYVTSGPYDAEAVMANMRLFCRGNEKFVLSEEEVDQGIKALFKQGHLGIFEHGWATYKIGCSRVTSHQIVRHRFSFLQRSQRAMKQSENTLVFPEGVPEALLDIAESQCVEHSLATYDQCLAKGVKREDARYLLPHGMNTELYMTANFRNWLHFLRLRLQPGAQWEIREIAEAIQQSLSMHYPRIFSREAIASMNYAPELKV